MFAGGWGVRGLMENNQTGISAQGSTLLIALAPGDFCLSLLSCLEQVESTAQLQGLLGKCPK